MPGLHFHLCPLHLLDHLSFGTIPCLLSNKIGTSKGSGKESRDPDGKIRFHDYMKNMGTSYSSDFLLAT